MFLLIELINLEYDAEALPKMAERLRAEHRGFRLELIQIEQASKFSSEIRKLFLEHEVEPRLQLIQVQSLRAAKNYSLVVRQWL